MDKTPGAVRPEEVGKQIIPQSPDTEVLEVPAVIDRPFEIDEGPKVAVVSFCILGARDMPKFDVKIAEIEQLLAGVVAKKPEGFTIGQMEEAKDVVTQYYRERGLILAQAVLPVQTVSGEASSTCRFTKALWVASSRKVMRAIPPACYRGPLRI